MSERDTYRATVTRDGKFWHIHIPGVGVTQARDRGEIEMMARDLISIVREVPADSFDLTIEASCCCRRCR